MVDLVVVTPDGSYPLVIEAIFQRPQAVGIRAITREIVKDALHDSSGNAIDLLRPYLGRAKKALLIRDFEVSGWEEQGAQALRNELTGLMQTNGWAEDSCAAIVVEPEIEGWLRMPSTHLENLVREKARRNRAHTFEQIRDGLERIIAGRGGRASTGKAVRPKETFEDLLRLFGIPRSNAHYQFLAERESLRRCESESFNTLVEILRGWFPVEANASIEEGR